MVETTDQGLLVGIDIRGEELSREPAELAAEILRLYKQAANRGAMRYRAELATAGVTDDILNRMGLPTSDDVARAELLDETQYDYEPRSWLGSI